jgi:putative ABC transport system substrate-binding protein
MRRLTRRQLLGAAGGAGLVGSAVALLNVNRAARKPVRVGFLGAGSSAPTSVAINSLTDAFRDGLREHGYIDGENITIEWRLNGDYPGVPFSQLATELVALEVQVIATSGTPAVVAAAQATQAIPIVSGGPNRDLGSLGLVESDARPGRNVTGTGANLQVYAKLVDLLKQTLPELARVGYLRNPTTPGTAEQMARSQLAAAELGLELLELQAATPDEVDAAFESAVGQRVQAVIVSADGLFGDGSGWRVTTLPLRHHMPTIYSQVDGYLDQGGLMAYSPDFAASQRRAAAYVAKILKGSRPADLPVEQAATFEFGINMKTARALGITIPEHVLVQATEIIG